MFKKEADNKLKDRKNSPTIQKIIETGTDPAGRPILDILSANNYFCVYEIAHEDHFSMLKISYDGETDADEALLAQRLNEIKPQYLEAKGLVYNSFGLISNKHRIAHLLSAVFTPSIDIKICKENFIELVKELRKERQAIIMNRLCYLLPCFLLLLCTLTAIIFSIDKNLILLLSVLSGSLLSLIFKANKKRFGDLVGAAKFCIILGLERTTISLIAGFIFYAAIQAGILIPSIFQDSNNQWSLYLAMIFAGYSETMAPNFLNKLTQKNENSNT